MAPRAQGTPGSLGLFSGPQLPLPSSLAQLGPQPAPWEKEARGVGPPTCSQDYLQRQQEEEEAKPTGLSSHVGAACRLLVDFAGDSGQSSQAPGHGSRGEGQGRPVGEGRGRGWVSRLPQGSPSPGKRLRWPGHGLGMWWLLSPQPGLHVRMCVHSHMRAAPVSTHTHTQNSSCSTLYLSLPPPHQQRGTAPKS